LPLFQFSLLLVAQVLEVGTRWKINNEIRHLSVVDGRCLLLCELFSLQFDPYSARRHKLHTFTLFPRLIFRFFTELIFFWFALQERFLNPPRMRQGFANAAGG